MRNLPSNIVNGVQKRIQAKSTNSDLSAVMWISRPTVPLTEDRFLEKQEVLSGNFDSVSVAVNRPSKYKGSSAIYIAVIKDGIAKVLLANYKDKMSAHVWVDTGFSEWAEDVSIAFDGTMPKDATGKVQFVTSGSPWVFWVLNGSLYAKNLYTDESITLAENNCTRVSAVRAMWSEVGNFDFGLIVFFILKGVIYYRQLIDGEWTDAEIVTFGPSSVTWVDISAQRTWDYRVAVQAMSSDGNVYELFTQYMGIGKQTVEHISLKADADGDLLKVNYHDTTQTEHLDLSAEASGSLIYGLSSMPVSAFNIADEENNWGKLVVVQLDYPITAVQGNGAAFSVFDSNGVEYRGVTAEAREDGLSVTISFLDINNAVGECSLRYTPGTVQSPAVPMESWSIPFLPVNLVPVAIDPPKVMEVWNE